jgi:hypothetical protein
MNDLDIKLDVQLILKNLDVQINIIDISKKIWKLCMKITMQYNLYIYNWEKRIIVEKNKKEEKGTSVWV